MRLLPEDLVEVITEISDMTTTLLMSILITSNKLLHRDCTRGKAIQFQKASPTYQKNPTKLNEELRLALGFMQIIVQGRHPLSRQILKYPVLNIAVASWQLLWLSCCPTARPELGKENNHVASEANL